MTTTHSPRTAGPGAYLQRLSGAAGELRWSPVGGGDIHGAWRAEIDGRSWFVKTNRPEARPLLTAERLALEKLAQAGALRVPEPLHEGSDSDGCWLIMEFLELRRSGDAETLGRGLAALHGKTGPAYGWLEDNFIGATPQRNGWQEDWSEFWWTRRIEPQLRLAVDRGPGRSLTDRFPGLEHALAGLLGDHRPPPSLLHGDLWAGNHGYLPDGAPVIFDPASCYGDRETDLAMTELFGGFDPRFRAAYEEARPVPAGYEKRRDAYQLYHLLNHLNLFGSAWLPRVESVLDRLGA